MTTDSFELIIGETVTFNLHRQPQNIWRPLKMGSIFWLGDTTIVESNSWSSSEPGSRKQVLSALSFL